jgi:pimeloyl-ACP methyl ester carboxylesterase
MTAKDEPSVAGSHEQDATIHHHAEIADAFTKQAEKLSLQPSPPSAHPDGPAPFAAAEALFVTPQDPVIVTGDGTRVPGVPLHEAHKLNVLKEELHGHPYHARQELSASPSGVSSESSSPSPSPDRLDVPPKRHADHNHHHALQKTADGTLRRSMPPSHTNPLFPPLPLYGPPSLLRNIQCAFFRTTSFFLSLAFLTVIVLGSLFTSIVPSARRLLTRLLGRDPDVDRPFYQEERRRAQSRKEKDEAWSVGRNEAASGGLGASSKKTGREHGGYTPTEGGPDPIVCDIGYYARRVGLAVEEFAVQTEDGFIIELYHVYDPNDQAPIPPPERAQDGPDLFPPHKMGPEHGRQGNLKFPVLLMHGLLQSAGAYCCTDENSLAFYLCKSGFDVWLGNNRCGFHPRHNALEYSDPRMWCWNIRQMGVFDLSALTSRVRHETSFDKIGLVAHSQGTTQTLVALAKEQRPELGEHLSVFCALAPAAYAGPLVGKIYLKFMRIISPAMFRMVFGIHAFIPFMMTMHSMLNPRLYGWLGYKVFSFLFNWTDTRWDRGLRDRLFQFSPVYVSAESMRWWLGRECFAKHKCILSTKEVVRAEEREDLEDAALGGDHRNHGPILRRSRVRSRAVLDTTQQNQEKTPSSPAVTKKMRGSTAWYDEKAPPFALWIAGSDDLVVGEKLLRRFRRGREPYVEVVHAKVIPEYEHLDVIWAMDAPSQIFEEMREVLWKTCPDRHRCRVPTGCENVEPWVSKTADQDDDSGVQSSSSNGEMT